MIVMGVPHGDGCEAWSKLFNRYNPKTPSRALMAMMAVMNPKEVEGRERFVAGGGGMEDHCDELKVRA